MIYLMIGLPGSGKSTYAKSLAKALNAYYTSPDLVREMVAVEYDRFDFSNKELSEVVYNTIFELVFKLSKRNDVVVDECNHKHVHRSRFYEIPHTKCKCIYINTPAEVCIERRLKETKDCNSDWVAVINKFDNEMDLTNLPENSVIVEGL